MWSSKIRKPTLFIISNKKPLFLRVTQLSNIFAIIAKIKSKVEVSSLAIIKATDWDAIARIAELRATYIK